MKEKKEKTNNQIIINRLFAISIIIILVLLLILVSNKTYNKLLSEKEFENSVMAFSSKNQETIFSINKIVFFSSCDSKNKTSTSTNFTIENLYAYTDIAIYIDNNSEENTLENTLKSLKISNVKITKSPTLGTTSLYYKSIYNFAKSEINEENLIENELEFNITSSEEANLDNPTLYNNCANPITLSYINQNIKTDYTMTDTENPIIYNGKLLERCNVELEKIEASVSFDVEIENNKDQKFRTTVYFDIPYKTEQDSIYNGSIKLNKDYNFNFYRYE